MGRAICDNNAARQRIDVTVVLTAHAEGRLAHRSVRSALRSIAFAERQGISCELVAVLDNSSPETRAYFRKRGYDLNKTVEVDFRDPGLARNHGAELASGRYITFLDADDLFSENWLASSFRCALARGSTAVLHPEVTVCFGARDLVWFHIASDDASFSPFDLIQANLWTVSCFVEKDFFLGGNRYSPTDLRGGFGHEDWHWNCEVIANGGMHLIVPHTGQFIRLKDEVSVYQRAKSVGAVFRPTKLFDRSASSASSGDLTGGSILPGSEAEWRSPSDRSIALGGNKSSALGAFAAGRRMMRFGVDAKFGLRDVYSSSRRAARRLVGRSLSGYPRFKTFCSATARLARESLLPPVAPPQLPQWLIDEWRRIHAIDPELFPTHDLIRSIPVYDPPPALAARHYPALSEAMGEAPTHVFLLPWLRTGGADLEAVHHITAAAKEARYSRVVCITTEICDSPWLSRLPEEVAVIEFGKLLASFSEADKLNLLLRLLLQKKPKVIHDIQSPLGHKLFLKNGRSLSAQSRLFASVFCVDVLPDGRSGGFPFAELPLIIDRLSGVFCDNQQFVDKLCDLYAFDEGKFSVIYFPAPTSSGGRDREARGTSLQVLWAGRFDRQKRPDVLMEVASRLVGASVHIHVYGSPLLDPEGYELLERLKRLPNVTVHGAFDDFGSLATDRYDVFLYTSAWDGLPNVLLEATAAGLPVIAPDVGGVGELINERTGFLVSRADAVEEYVSYIKMILTNPRIADERMIAAKDLIRSRHSWSAFVERLKGVPGYVTDVATDEEASRNLDRALTTG